MENEDWKNWNQPKNQGPELPAEMVPKKKLTHQKVFSTVLCIALAGSLTVNFLQMGSGAGSSGSDYAKLHELQRLIEKKYIGETDPASLEDGAAAGMIEAMGDRWSYYIPASQMEAHEEAMANAYVGVGITILLEKKEDGFYIQQVNPNGPAHDAGILPGDILVGVEGQTTEEMLSEDAKELIRGPEGTSVNVTILRDGEKKDFTLERRTIEVDVAVGKMVTEDIGLVTIVNFDDRCAEEAIEAIEDLRSQGAKKLIFDVRFNPGGYAHELVKLLDYLLPEGDLFRTEDYAGRKQVDTSDARYLDMPMAVLVNGDSYSAAEFFAAALMEYEAATIVGEKTTGKGRFQQTHHLKDGSAANISVGNYYTPKGVSLDGVGITPDIEVKVEEETAMKIVSQTIEPEDDPQLQAAIKALQ